MFWTFCNTNIYLHQVSCNWTSSIVSNKNTVGTGIANNQNYFGFQIVCHANRWTPSIFWTRISSYYRTKLIQEFENQTDAFFPYWISPQCLNSNWIFSDFWSLDFHLGLEVIFDRISGFNPGFDRSNWQHSESKSPQRLECNLEWIWKKRKKGCSLITSRTEGPFSVTLRYKQYGIKTFNCTVLNAD